MENSIGCYIRLSRTDNILSEGQHESNSITNQRELIHHYLNEHQEFSGWNIQEFVDDGYSGISETRPEFQRMINLAQHGQLKCIIVKDFSRFARNYVTMGDYLEQIFPLLGVRFISINDRYDSAVSISITDNMSMVIKSILNSYYSRDLSAKIFSSNTQRMKDGRFTGRPCFGYTMNQERTHFVIDSEAAQIVRFIFDLALAGKTRPEIVNILNSKGFPTPAEYNRQSGHGKKDIVTAHPLWDHVKVTNILRQEVYTGKLIMRKRVKVAPCAKKYRPTDISEQFVREYAHEPIISQEEFDRVQSLIPKRKGWDRKHQQQYPLKGLVRCGICGKVMTLRKVSLVNVFQCQESLIKHSVCPRKTYPMSEVEQFIFLSLQPLMQHIIQGEQRYGQKQKDKQCAQYKRDMLELQQKKNKLQQKKIQCYEEYVSGKLSLDNYLKKKSLYNYECFELDQQLSTQQKQEKTLFLPPISEGIRQATEGAKLLFNTTGLTREMVTYFVHCVYLYETHIEIQWKFKDQFEDFTVSSIQTEEIQSDRKHTG